jgi:hypothetical protein
MSRWILGTGTGGSRGTFVRSGLRCRVSPCVRVFTQFGHLRCSMEPQSVRGAYHDLGIHGFVEVVGRKVTAHPPKREPRWLDGPSLSTQPHLAATATAWRRRDLLRT